jgi:hypothetical protein
MLRRQKSLSKLHATSHGSTKKKPYILLDDFLELLGSLGVEEKEVKEVGEIFHPKSADAIGVDIADFFEKTFRGVMPALMATQAQRGAERTDDHEKLVAMFQLGFSGHLPAPYLQELWGQLAPENRFYFATSEIYSEPPIALAARAGNIEALELLCLDRDYFSKLPTTLTIEHEDIAEYFGHLKNALLEAGKKGHAECVFKLLSTLANLSREATSGFLYHTIILNEKANEPNMLELLAPIYATLFAQMKSSASKKVEKANAALAINAISYFLKTKGIGQMVFFGKIKPAIEMLLPPLGMTITFQDFSNPTEIKKTSKRLATIQLKLAPSPDDEDELEDYEEASKTAVTSTERDSEDKKSDDESSSDDAASEEESHEHKHRSRSASTSSSGSGSGSGSDSDSNAGSGSKDGSDSENATDESHSDDAASEEESHEHKHRSRSASASSSGSSHSHSSHGSHRSRSASTSSAGSRSGSDSDSKAGSGSEDDSDSELASAPPSAATLMTPAADVTPTPAAAPLTPPVPPSAPTPKALDSKSDALSPPSVLSEDELKRTLDPKVFTDKEAREYLQHELDNLFIALDKSNAEVDIKLRSQIENLIQHSFNDPNPDIEFGRKLLALADIQSDYHDKTKRRRATSVGLALAAFAIAAAVALLVATGIALTVFLITSPAGPASFFAAFAAFVKSLPLAAQIGASVASCAVGGGVGGIALFGFYKKSDQQVAVDNALDNFVAAANRK